MLPDFRLRQREYLLEISRAMTARLDLSSLLKLILQSATDILAGQAGLITLRLDDNSFGPYASIGLPREALHLLEPLWRDLAPKPPKQQSDTDEKTEEKEELDVPLRLALASRAAGVTLRQVVALPLEIGQEMIGYIFIFRTYGTAFSNDDQHVLSAFANQAAISVQNAQLYREINTERERLTAIIENSGDGVMIVNRYRIIQTWNKALDQLTGIPSIEAIGRPCYEILNLRTAQGVSVCHNSCPLIRPPADGRLFAEGIHHRADGLKITFSDNYSPQYNKEEELSQFIANVRDVTHFREAEQLKQTILSVISHELKTPVSIIKGYAGTLAREDANWDGETLLDGLKVIEEEADRLDRLITNLLEASRLQGGGFKLRLSYLDLEGLLQTSVDNLQTTTEDHTITVEIAADFPSIVGDYERLREVFTNLLSNAIKYSPDGGEIAVIGSVLKENMVRISVADQGIGIPPADQQHVFDRFYRVDNRLARQTPGTGLGLYLVKAVVEAHGGQVAVESASGKGSTFIVDLPVNPQEGHPDDLL